MVDVSVSTLASPRTESLLPAGLAGSLGMVFVGGSVAVSGALAGAPVLTVQALRYGVACLLLLLFARRSGVRLAAPRGAEWLWLSGVVVTGMFVFNLALVHGSRHAEPAVLGVAVACVPILLAVAGPVLQGQRPVSRLVLAAVVVTAGAALVQGLGRTDRIGLLWALVTFACEAGFTLLAMPVLGRHGPIGVSVHSTWMAAILFGLCAVVSEGPTAVTRLDLSDVLAGCYLAVAVTAVAFVLWYTCVSRLGAARAGLLTGIAPIAAAGTGVLMGGPMPRPMVWAGILTVACGLALGLALKPRPADPGPGLRPGAVDLGQGVALGVVGLAPGTPDLDGSLAPGISDLGGRVAPGTADLGQGVALGVVDLGPGLAPGVAGLSRRLTPGVADFGRDFTPGAADRG